MQSYKQNHSCQINCNNQQQVINALEMKSKDLYYFWRNYEWLYNKYYGERRNAQYQQSDRELEQIEKLTIQNKKLKIDNESLKKQIEAISNNPNNIVLGLQRQNQRLSVQCKNQIQVIENRTNTIARMEDEIKKLNNQILELQRYLDEKRDRMVQGNGGVGNQNIHFQQKWRKQSQRIQVLMTNVEKKAYEILDDEFESTRQKLLEQFPHIIEKFAQGDVKGLIEEIQQE